MGKVKVITPETKPTEGMPYKYSLNPEIFNNAMMAAKTDKERLAISELLLACNNLINNANIDLANEIAMKQIKHDCFKYILGVTGVSVRSETFEEDIKKLTSKNIVLVCKGLTVIINKWSDAFNHIFFVNLDNFGEFINAIADTYYLD